MCIWLPPLDIIQGFYRNLRFPAKEINKRKGGNWIRGYGWQGQFWFLGKYSTCAFFNIKFDKFLELIQKMCLCVSLPHVCVYKMHIKEIDKLFYGLPLFYGLQPRRKTFPFSHIGFLLFYVYAMKMIKVCAWNILSCIHKTCKAYTYL